MKRLVFITIGIALLMASCQRNVIAPGETLPPAYRLSGTLDGEPFTVAVGDYVLNPVYESTDYGVYGFIADFEKDANNSFSIRLHDDEQSWSSNDVDANSVFNAEAKLFDTGGLNVAHNVIEVRSTSGNQYEYQWVFNDDEISENGPVVDEHTVPEGSQLTIGVKVLEDGQVLDSLELNIDQEFSAATPIQYSTFTTEYQVDPNRVYCIFDGDLSKVQTITWTGVDPNGNNIAGQSGSACALDNPIDGVYKITMNVELQNGIIYKHARNIVHPEGSDAVAANIDFRTKVDEGEIQDILGRVVIEYVDDGVLYTSANVWNEDGDSEINFEITEKFETLLNSAGQESIELGVIISCDLENVNNANDVLELRDFEGKIVVSYPSQD